MTNPLLSPSPLDYQLPDFRAITVAHAVEAVDEGIKEQLAEVKAITQEAEPTWENTIEALERSGRTLDRALAWLFNLQGTDGDEELNNAVAAVVPKLSTLSDAIYQDAELFRRVRDIAKPNDEEAQHLHELYVRRFTERGAMLDEAGKKRLAEINQRLGVLADEFGRNLLKETRELAVHFDSAEDLEGMSDAAIDAARQAAREAGRAGYLLPLELPTVQSAQSELVRPESRQKVWEASQRRGEKANPEVLIEEVKLRAEKAELLGFKNHAELTISEETAKTADAARGLLYDLAPAAAANAQAEFKLVSEEASANDQTASEADWPYWESKVRARDYSFDEDAARAYFPLSQVLEKGVFFAANRLYGITVEPRDDLPGYAEGVRVWEVKESAEHGEGSSGEDRGGEGIGLLITDYFGRPTKRGGAWMSSFVDQSHLLDQKPVVVNVMGITRPTDGSEPLLTVDQVTTIFHEFGHGLHGLLSDVRYPSLSGTSVPRDWVEFPSQINENWAFEPTILNNYAHHVETGEVIPAELVAALKRSRTFGQGFATAEYLGAAIIDLAWHSLSLADAAKLTVADIERVEREALEASGLGDVVRPRYASTYFNHIFAGGYSAGYYSYLWAEALDADGYTWFEETGAPSDDAAAREAGQRFRDLVLSKGASRDYGEAFKAMRGREKDVTALLRRRGLEGALGADAAGADAAGADVAGAGK